MLDVMHSISDTQSRAPEERLVAGLYWGVRESFVSYVISSPDGQMFGDEGVESDGQGMFRFPARQPATNPRAQIPNLTGPWSIDFTGSLRFIAHFGALDVTLSGLRAELATSGQGSLSISDSKGNRHEIARLLSAPPVAVESWIVWPPVDAALTEYGSELLGGVYGEGAALDPLRIVISADPTGAEA